MWEQEIMECPVEEEVKGQGHNMLCGGPNLTQEAADNLWPIGQWSTSVKWPHKKETVTEKATT